jgi:hypothetical protein
MSNFDINELRAKIEYRDGALWWKAGSRAGQRVGGVKNEKGYVRFWLNRKLVRYHRAVWELHNGPIPDGHVLDHINRDKSDNRIENLRLVDHTENAQNRLYGSPIRGVTQHKDGKRWVAYWSGTRKEKRAHLGIWDTIEEAATAVAQYKQGIGT